MVRGFLRAGFGFLGRHQKIGWILFIASVVLDVIGILIDGVSLGLRHQTIEAAMTMVLLGCSRHGGGFKVINRASVYIGQNVGKQ